MHMAPVIFAIVFGVGWVFALLIAINDFRILIRGRFEEDTNPTDIPIEQLTGFATRPAFIRSVAALRLIFAVAWIITVPAIALRALWG